MPQMDIFGAQLTTDSRAYEILTKAVIRCKEAPGLICEIGTRRGGSAKFIIDAIVNHHDKDRTLVCVDPYGNIEYMERDNNPVHHDYTNDMRRETIPYLYGYAYNKIKNFVFFNMEDTEYFNRFSDGVPIYVDKVKSVVNQYACVFFDGPHDFPNVKLEVEFFLPRTSINSTFVFDDVYDNRYDHERIEAELLFPNGWEKLNEANPKKSYVKVK